MNEDTPMRLLLSIGLVHLGLAAVAACVRQEPPAPPYIAPAGGAVDDDPGPWLPPEDDEDASVRLAMSARQLADLNVGTANLTYKFTYLDVERQGDITFVGDKAEIVLAALPSGRSGAMALEIAEAGTPRLAGRIDDLVLTAGRNQRQLKLETLGDGGGGGGGDNAELVLILETNGVGGGSGNSRISFDRDVRANAVTYCGGGACHAAEAGQEQWWTDRRATIPSRINNGSMPKPGSPAARTITADIKRTMLEFLEQ